MLGLGPLYSALATNEPQRALADLAVQTAAQAAADAFQKALEPPSREEKEAAQKEESRRAQEDRDRQQQQQQQAEALRVQAEQLRVTTSTAEGKLETGKSKADAFNVISQMASFNTGAGFDSAELEMGAEAAKAIERMEKAEQMGQSKDGTLDMSALGLTGYTPEISSFTLQRAGVIRLSLQDDSIPTSVADPMDEDRLYTRGGKITPLSNGDMSVRVRLDYADGSVTNTEMVFRKVEDSSNLESASEIAGRISPQEKRLAA
ncbi:MAG: hypothetical protein J0M12_09670 [Deltaproteobacteria bacterium]|nr:hypothetical protein [Deltaproteobacteria bacterium]